MKKFALFGLGSAAALMMSACTVGSTDEGNSNVVSNYEDLPTCSAAANYVGVSYAGQKFYVEEEEEYYLCKGNSWVLSDASPVSGNSNQEFMVDSATVIGKASLGGFFKIGSQVVLRELKFDSYGRLKETGNTFNDEISSADGDFVISNVSLTNKYALIEVSGLYQDMWTGEVSKDTIKLSALVDVSSDDEVKVDLFSEVEIPRIKKLVKDGYAFSAAKIQAEHEVLSSLGFGSSVEEIDAAVLATSILFRNLGDVKELSKSMKAFGESIAEDGTWKDQKSKTAFADFAYAVENKKLHDDETNELSVQYSELRKNLAKFGIDKVPGFEAFISKFWQAAYGLGTCNATRASVVIKNQDEKSDSAETYFICKSSAWAIANEFERDTVGLGNVTDGTIMEGNIDSEKLYVFDSTGIGSGNPVRWLPIETAMWDVGRADGKMADSLVLDQWLGAACTDYEDVQYSVTMTVNEDNDTTRWGCSNRKWNVIDPFVFKMGSMCGEGTFDDKVYEIEISKVKRYLFCDSTISSTGTVTWAWDETKTIYDMEDGVCDGKHKDVIGKVVVNKDDSENYKRCAYGSGFAWVTSTKANSVMQKETECPADEIVSKSKNSYVCTGAVKKDKQVLYYTWREAKEDEIEAEKPCVVANIGQTIKHDGADYQCAAGYYNGETTILIIDPESPSYADFLLGWYNTATKVKLTKS